MYTKTGVMFAILRYKQTQSTDQSHNFDFNMAKNNLKRASAASRTIDDMFKRKKLSEKSASRLVIFGFID